MAVAAGGLVGVVRQDGLTEKHFRVLARRSATSIEVEEIPKAR
jgi:hypothetical protein